MQRYNVTIKVSRSDQPGTNLEIDAEDIPAEAIQAPEYGKGMILSLVNLLEETVEKESAKDRRGKVVPIR